MGKSFKKLYWAGAGVAFLFILLIAAAIFLPRVIGTAWLKETIHTELAKKVEGEFDFQEVELSILPLPTVALHQVSLTMPNEIKAKLDTLEVYPRLIPLLAGKIELDKIVIDKLDYSVPIPQRMDIEPDAEEKFSLNAFLQGTSEELTPILSAFAGLEVGIRNGTLRLLEGDKEVYLFDKINTDLNTTTDSLTVTMSSTSNIWKNIKLMTEFIPSTRTVKGRIAFDRINNKELIRYFLADRKLLLGESFTNLQLDFSVSPDDGLSAEFKCSDSTLAILDKNNDQVIAEIANLEGNIHHTDAKSSLTVDDLTLSYPHVQLSGSFNYDRTKPNTSLDIKSHNANITETREVLPRFFKELYGELPVVQEIFNIVRGGTVTRASMQVEGKSPADLAEFEAMTIKGHIADTNITLSGLGLNLQEVTGDALIARGILDAKNLQAQLGKSTGSGGTLKLGLVKKETTPFHLDLDLDTDLSEVIPLLKQLIPPKKDVIEYLSLLEIIEGSGQVRLTLGQSLESISVQADMNKISARANFKPIPYPITIDGCRIIYDRLKTESHDLKGKIGKSTFSNYSSQINFADEPTIEIHSGSLQLDMDEIFPWLSSYDKLSEELEGIQNITGQANITARNIKGPLLAPARVRYDLQCSMEDFTLKTAFLPGPLNIKGRAIIVPDKITLESMQADLLDSSFAFSGILQNFITGKTGADITVVHAEIGQDFNTWFSEQTNIPRAYMLRTPLMVSQAHLKWTMAQLLDLQGEFSIKEGPGFAVNMMLNPDELLLRSFVIRNEEEQATMKLDLQKRKIGAGFQGSLSKKTIDAILLHNDLFPEGWVKGDIHFQIDMDSFASSSAAGKLDGGDFIFPWKTEKPILLDSFSFFAAEKTLKLNSFQAQFENNNYAINGEASLVEEGLTMDFDVRTDTVELNKILAAIKEEDEQGLAKGKRVGKEWDLAVRANIKLHADSLLYNGYTWKPFESLITFANNSLGIEIFEAELCSIATPGRLSFHEKQIYLDFKMQAEDKEFKDVLICLEGGEQQMTGILDLDATIKGQGTRETLINSLEGELQYSSKDGYIYQDARAAKLLN
ncbi:MAG: AsmA family protein, partial [Deltaproteobacteria bacterium]|nr:AsmA family protein [Deltaproteobacteria bacterium]